MLGLGLNINSAPTPSGYISGASYANEYAVFTDGTGDLVKLGVSAADLQSLIVGESGFSISFWIHDDAFSNGVLWGFNDTSSNTFLYSQILSLGGSVYFSNSVKYNDNSNPSSLYNAGDISGGWHHVVFTQEVGAFDATQGTFKFYLDGSLVETLSTSTRFRQTTTTLSSGTLIPIGALRTQTGTVSSHVSVTFDEFAIWDMALKASHVSAVYNSGVPFDLTGENGGYTSVVAQALQAYYRFENNFSDTTGNHSDATTEGDAAIVQSPTPP
jgi:hypothetical protein